MTKPGGESRRRKRVPLALSGHYVLESGCNYPCQTENVSATGILLRGFPGGDLGEWVVVYLSELGRIEGTIVRSEDTCFAFEIAATPSQTQKLAAKLASLSCNHNLFGFLTTEANAIVAPIHIGDARHPDGCRPRSTRGLRREMAGAHAARQPRSRLHVPLS
jgi:hypothetical protein